jgi:type IV pilus assembly protein PilY1
VDGSPQAADVWAYPSPTTTAKSVSEWRTVVMGGLREGGRSYYALDVTDPASGQYPGYLWEWPLESDPDDVNVSTSHLWYLGESWSKPIITRVRVKVNTNDNNGLGFERWVAIVTGGMAETGNPNDHASYDASRPEGRAIVMLDMKTGEPLAVKRYDASASDAQSDMRYAIPSTPAVFDLNGDGFADVVYVGDLGGQVFKWVINPIGEDRVNDASPAGDYSQPNWPFKLFFSAPTATDSGDTYYKSFFFPPSATYVGKTLYLAIGSGERSNIFFEGIAGVDENNRFYVFTDPDPYEVSPTPFATLLESALTDVTNDQTCSTVSPRGYYLRLVDGEKFVTNSEIFAGIVFAGSFLPASTGDPCTAKGTGALYAFRVECGAAYFADGNGVGMRRVDIDEGLPTDPQISVGVNGKDNRIYIEKSGADLESIGAPDVNLNNGALLYWREVR